MLFYYTFVRAVEYMFPNNVPNCNIYDVQSESVVHARTVSVRASEGVHSCVCGCDGGLH